MSTIEVTNINDVSGNASLVTDNGGLKTDKLTGKTTAGSIAVTGEGNSTTTNLQQGLCKAWVGGMNHTSQDFEDSFNASSYTDPGTGRGTITLTNNMNNATYSVTHGSMNNYPYQAISDSTSQYTLSNVSSSLSFVDAQCNGMVVGDLA